MLKQHDIDIKDVTGTGKGGRVMKEDVQKYLDSRNSVPKPLSSKSAAHIDAAVEDKVVPLTPIEAHMFKVMTRALSIPHFGYSHSVDLTALTNLRRKFNRQLETSSETHGHGISKLTALPFILKALSQAFLRHPRLNSHLETEAASQNPHLILKASHNFGVAMDHPQWPSSSSRQRCSKSIHSFHRSGTEETGCACKRRPPDPFRHEWRYFHCE